MAVSEYALCTLVQVKQHLKKSGTDDDALLEELINAASAAIESKCRRQFRERTYTDERHDGNGRSNVVFLRHRPIVSVDSLYDDPGRTFEAISLIDPADYEVFGGEGYIVRVGVPFSVGVRNIKITYNAGSAEAPADIVEGAVLLTMDYFQQSTPGGGHQGIKSEALPQGQGTRTLEHGPMPQRVLALLAPYIRVEIA